MTDDAGRAAPATPDPGDPAAAEPEDTVRTTEREPGDLGHLLLALVLVAVAVLAAFAARDISGRAATWPWLLIVTLLVLTLWEAVARARRVLGARRTGHAGKRTALTVGTGARRRAFYSAWLLGFAGTALTAGFGWATLVFLPVYQWAAGSRRIVRIGLVTACVVAAFHLLFAELAGVPLW
jgi:hypothetical protein